MADSNGNAFHALENITDDSVFVHQAMDKLGFFCEFAELPIFDQSLVLALALHIKRTEEQRMVDEYDDSNDDSNSWDS